MRPAPYVKEGAHGLQGAILWGPLLGLLGLLLSCQGALGQMPEEAAEGREGSARIASPSSTPEAPALPEMAQVDAERQDGLVEGADAVPWDRYAWLAEHFPDATPLSLRTRFASPPGYTRLTVAEGSFAEWLRYLPVREDPQVYAYDGRPLQAPAAAVVLLDVGDRDLQQCADAIIRLHAEYLWSSGQFAAIAYHFTNGVRSAWLAWADGERFAKIDGRLRGVSKAKKDHGRAAFRAYLQHLFIYAGTRSLPKDARALAEEEALRPGDFFNQAGSPGHAVLILDIAVDAAGHQVALLGQSYMPAQDFHVLTSSAADVVDGIWFPLPVGALAVLRTPSWAPFSRADAYRLPE